MEFRWVAIIALWTLLAGPMFDSPLGSQKAGQAQSSQSSEARIVVHRR